MQLELENNVSVKEKNSAECLWCWTSFEHNMHTHTHTFNGPLSRTTRVSRYQKGKTNLDFTEAGDSEWQWHQLGHMQLSFLQAGCPSCHPTNSVKALKAY